MILNHQHISKYEIKYTQNTKKISEKELQNSKENTDNMMIETISKIYGSNCFAFTTGILYEDTTYSVKVIAFDQTDKIIGETQLQSFMGEMSFSLSYPNFNEEKVDIYFDESVTVFGLEWDSPFGEIFFLWFLYITHLAIKTKK